MYSRHEIEEHAHQLDALANRSGDAFDIASKMLRQYAKNMPQPSEPAWQQQQQRNLERLHLMPSTDAEGNSPGQEPIHNHGDSDGPASEDYTPAPSDVPVDPPSSEEPSAA